MIRRAVLAALAALSTFAGPALAADVALPYERFTLANGLKVIVHTDRKAPVVSVNVLYKVGSEDEAADRTGFAHMFEHLMFLGSSGTQGGFHKPLQEAGATGINASTWWDYTEFHETVPTSALELALWLEADRMGRLAGALQPEAVERERGVVKNELRQKENAPFGRVEPLILPAIFPPGHPYRWSPLGVLEDLDAATLDDIRAWHARHYGPNNAILTLAGDIDATAARGLAERYFGGLKPAPLRVDLAAFAAPLPAARREVMTDTASNARIYRAWPTPGAGDPASAELDLLVSVLGDGPGSILTRRLVKDRQVASNASVLRPAGRAASSVLLVLDVKAGVAVAEASTALDGVLAELRANGPAPAELAAARARLKLRRARDLDANSDTAFALAVGEAHAGRPDRIVADLARMDAATPEGLRDLAQTWLSDRSYQLEVIPSAAVAPTAGPPPARPAVGPAPTASVPVIHRQSLANGLAVVSVQRPGDALVRLGLQFDAGLASDPASQAGRAALALDLLDEGGAGRGRDQLLAEIDRLGGQYAARTGLDASSLTLTALMAEAPAAARLLSQLVRAPAFPADAVARGKAERLAQIGRETARPTTTALRLIPARLFAGPYGAPGDGLGVAAEVAKLAPADLAAFATAWLRPERATLFVVGDLTPEQALVLGQAAFGDWRPAAGPEVEKPAPRPAVRSGLLLVDRPGSVQSVITVAQLSPAEADPATLTALNQALGGAGWSRANHELREARGWAYYALSRLGETRGADPILFTAPVQADRTLESVRLLKELLDGAAASRPVSEAELAKVKSLDRLSQAGRYESSGALLDALMANAELKRPDAYLAEQPARLQAVTLDETRRLAAQVFKGERVWVVATDVARFGEELKALGLGPAEVVDPNTVGAP